MEKIKESEEKSGKIKETFKKVLNNVSLIKFAAFLIILKIIDVSTTYYSLTYLDATEMNPLVTFIINKIGLIPAMIAVLGIYSAIIYKVFISDRPKRDKAVLYIAIMLLMMIVDANNIFWMIYY